MSSKSPKKIRAKIFNIDKEAHKFYPKDRVLIPSAAGLQAFHLMKLHANRLTSGDRYTSFMMRRA